MVAECSFCQTTAPTAVQEWMVRAMREKLIELLMDMPFGNSTYEAEERHMEATADYLIANGVTIQQWIPVAERLPEEMDKVLAIAEGVRITAVLKSGTWLSSWNHDVVEAKVTHWMPLPEAPRGN